MDANTRGFPQFIMFRTGPLYSSVLRGNGGNMNVTTLYNRLISRDADFHMQPMPTILPAEPAHWQKFWLTVFATVNARDYSAIVK